ncbi:unnamed protein product [Blepharisma stoltei]|uniref:Uncharacterized protein n=1 Tax=Blepharisma stoltei TaxID=1481888 RepID=A0AAU9JTJ1_9CILI|nr:unnamed protein product [Blepharisma stoltei]
MWGNAIQISNKELLFAGPKAYSNWGAAGIIDFTRYEIAMFFPFPFEDDFFGFWVAYFEQNVYVFGLSKINRNQNSVAKKLSLTKSRWKALAAPPANVDECSCVFYKHSILIAGGKKNKIYQYNIDLDSYLERDPSMLYNIHLIRIAIQFWVCYTSPIQITSNFAFIDWSLVPFNQI